MCAARFMLCGRFHGMQVQDSVNLIKNMGKLPGIEFIGFVDDIRSFLWKSKICIVPLRSGGGTRLKILEALAANCPVVSTSIGAEGLELINGRDLFIADNPENFANFVLLLEEEQELYGLIQKSGHHSVTKKYDWTNIAPQLEIAYETIVDRMNIEQ